MNIDSPRWWIMWAGIQIVVLVGYAASSLSQWAGWVEGAAAVRLALVQSVLTAILSGNIAYLLCLYYNLAEVYAVVAGAGGGFMGDKFLVPIFDRIGAGLSGLLGKGIDRSGTQDAGRRGD